MLNHEWDPVWRSKKSYAGSVLRTKKAARKLDWLIAEHMVEKNNFVIDVGCGGGILLRNCTCAQVAR